MHNLQGTVFREYPSEVLPATKRFLEGSWEPLLRDGSPTARRAFQPFLRTRDDLPDSFEEVDPLAHLDAFVEYQFGGDLGSYMESTPFIAGTPETCIDRIRWLDDRVGIDELVIRPSTYDLPTTASDETLRLLGDAVLLAF